MHEHEHWKWVWCACRTSVMCSQNDVKLKSLQYIYNSHIKETSKVLIDGVIPKMNQTCRCTCRLQRGSATWHVSCTVGDVGHSRMSLAMCTKSIGVVRAMVCSMDAKKKYYTATTWKLGWCLTFYIPVWASSWGAKLYFCFQKLLVTISPLI